MDNRQVMNDLRAIREIMDRTRESTSGESGWFSVVGGMMWLVGFLGNQFLPGDLSGWLWLVVNSIGLLLMAWLCVRLTKEGHVSSPVMRSIMLSWLALLVFAGLFLWLFEVHTVQSILLVILIVTGLGCTQMGLLFFYWLLCFIGVAIAAVSVAAYLLIPDYYSLVASLLGGGLLIGSGLWQVYSGRRAKEATNGS
jgi:hypothetical protein